MRKMSDSSPRDNLCRTPNRPAWFSRLKVSIVHRLLAGENVRALAHVPKMTRKALDVCGQSPALLR
jgi:hypothetical protein